MNTHSVKVILNGDDFGYTRGANKGIRESIENGILTSTSVMVNRTYASEVKQLNQYKNISVGIHLDFTEENYLKRWSKVLYILTWSESKLRSEFKKQIDKFTDLTGHLPHHIDSHHHVHWITPLKHIVLEFSKKNKVPVRCANATFELGFYGRSIFKWNDSDKVNSDRLISVIRNLTPGIHEIMCHPGFVDNYLVKSGTSYLTQRESEVKALTSKKVKEFLKSENAIQLISWKEAL